MFGAYLRARLYAASRCWAEYWQGWRIFDSSSSELAHSFSLVWRVQQPWDFCRKVRGLVKSAAVQ
jgi:hypothetical protein